MRIRTFIIPFIMGSLLLTGAELYKSFDTVKEVNLQDNPELPAGTLNLDEEENREKRAVYQAEEDLGLKYYQHPVLKKAVVDYFAEICGSAEIADTILANAAENEISASLAFALAWKESSFKPGARNINTNGSQDRGLFQLNSRYFMFQKEEDVYNFRINTERGLQHLKYCLDRGGSEVVALAMYNAGGNAVTQGNTPLRTLNYIQKILNYRDELEEGLENHLKIYLAGLPVLLLDHYLKINLTEIDSLNSLYE